MHKITLHSWKHDSCFQLNIPIGAAVSSRLSGPVSLWDSREQLLGSSPLTKSLGRTALIPVIAQMTVASWEPCCCGLKLLRSS